MAFLIIFAILAVIALPAFFFGPYIVPSEDRTKTVDLVLRGIVVGIFTVLFVPLVFFTSYHRVSAGHVGVVYGIGGNITGQRGDGSQFTLPWQSLKVVSVQQQVFRPTTKCSDNTEQCIDTFSKDNQDVFVRATLRYHIDASKVQELMRSNPNYVDRSIVSRFAQLVKDETVKYTSTELAAQREQIRANIEAKFATELAPESITVDNFFIDNIDFRPEFKQAIEAKVKAEQDAAAEQNKVAISQAQAQQKAAAAQGDADSLRITAQGQADANRLIAESLTPALIEFQAIQKLNPNVQVMLLPSNGNPLFDVSKLLTGQGG